MSKTIATQIAEVAVNTKFENLPEEAVVKAKTLTLDVLASMLGTRDVISSVIAREVAEEMGGPGESATLVAIILGFLAVYVAIVIYKRRKRRRESL